MSINQIISEKDSNKLFNLAIVNKDDINKYFMYLTQAANLGNKDAIDRIDKDYQTRFNKKQIFDKNLVDFSNCIFHLY